MTTVFESPDELPGAVGTHLGYSDWVTIDQERVNLFADATGDHQWIHLGVRNGGWRTFMGRTTGGEQGQTEVPTRLMTPRGQRISSLRAFGPG